MKVAICAGKTLSGPGEGTVAIKSEAIEARKIVSELIALLEAEESINVKNCTVDSAVSEIVYTDAVSKNVNDFHPDIFVSIEFYGSVNHCGEPIIYSKQEMTEEMLLLKKYTDHIGYRSMIAHDSSTIFKLLKQVMCTNSMVFKVCPIDSPRAMQLYDPFTIARNIFMSIVQKEPQDGWYIEIDGSKKYFKQGTLCTGITEIDDHKYYFDENGYLVYGFIELGPMDWMYSNPKTGILSDTEWIMNRMQVYRVEDYKVVLPDPNNMDILPTRIIDGITYTFDKIGCVENEIRRLNGVGKVSFYIGANDKVYPYIQGIENSISVYEPFVYKD